MPDQRIGLGVLWIAVAALALLTVEEFAPTLSTAASLVAALLALWLAALYLLNPWNLLDRLPH